MSDMLSELQKKLVGELQSKLADILVDDCLAAALRGHWDVTIGHWIHGNWKAAVVLQGNDPVLIVGPRRRIEIDMVSSRTHIHARIVTEEASTDDP